MIDFRRNNLDRSDSLYLRQHASNPIWWQEWSSAVIEESVRRNNPLFVSVGYAACHWCHVMSSEAFSDRATADYVNEHFICIKVDRDERPDIDQDLMRYLTAQSGSGGWPLNAFLTPRLQPFFALTYAPGKQNSRMKSFLEIAQAVHAYFLQNADHIPSFRPAADRPDIVGDDTGVETLSSFFDPVHGGLGTVAKFPPHSTLLYLLYNLCVKDHPEARRACALTLEAMRRGGLHDHLQGGIFRYCVDRSWTIPHFEKMLYDQAMALWCYALAYRVFQSEPEKSMAEGIVRCLEETFENDGLFVSAHDADTRHVEGGTYLWRYDEIAEALTPEEFAAFRGAYRIERAGNFEGSIHLIRTNDAPLREIEKKLLAIRRRRPQPPTDDKILCGLNALAAIALIQAARLLNWEELEQRADRIVRRLWSLFWDGRSLAHSFSRGNVQKQAFLFDAAAMLTAVSMLHENDESWLDPLGMLARYLESFKDGENWVESRAEDFRPVAASRFDHPIPSSGALAEMAATREALREGKNLLPAPHRRPGEADFANIAVMMRNGLFHVITTKTPIPWNELPANTLRVRGDQESDCYRGTCEVLKLRAE
jgi:uncharacterized protein YyaL (SSP411 family)